MDLHPSQKKLLELLKNSDLGPLSIRQLQQEIEAKSPSVVQHHILQLEKKGYLRKNPNNPQDYQVLADSPDKNITYLNIYGMAQCGPNGTLLDGNPIDRVPVSTRILGFPSDEAFIVKAKGDSMCPKINPNDYVIVRKSNTALNNQVVVCVNDGGVMIKKLQQIEDNHGGVIYLLNSFNEDKYPPFKISSDFRVEGIVKGVLSYSI
jgi:repressor LexA